MKPKAPVEYRGEFEPIATSAPGITLCEHLPMLAKQAHHLALVNSISGTVNTNDHHAGYYHNLTGHVPDPTFLSKGNNRTPYPDDWPYMGCVVAANRPLRDGIPNAVTMPWKPSQAPYTRPGQFAGKLGIKFDPLYVYGNRKKTTEFKAPDLVLSSDVPSKRLFSRHELLTQFDDARRDLDRRFLREVLELAAGTRHFIARFRRRRWMRSMSRKSRPRPWLDMAILSIR